MKVIKWMYLYTIEYLIGIGLLVIVLLTGLEVFNRYALGSPQNWTEELARLLLVWAVSLGTAAGIKRNSHLKIDFIYEKYKGVTKKIMITIINIVVLLVGIGMYKYGIAFYESTVGDYSTSLGYARNLFYLPIAISGVMVSLFVIVNTIQEWRMTEDRREP